MDKPAAVPPKPYRHQLDRLYGERDGLGLLMDVFRPHKPDGRWVLNPVSGAYFSRRENIDDLIGWRLYDHLADYGITVFAVRPGCRSRVTLPEMIDHLWTAAAYVIDHAEEFSIDPHVYGVTGISAGGHLASLLALNTPPAALPRPKAAGVFCPPAEWLEWMQLDDDRALNFRGLIEGDGPRFGRAPLTPDELHCEAKRWSPARLVTPAAPPFRIVHARGDAVVPLWQSERLVEALRNAGREPVFDIIESDDHVWPDIPRDMARMADWLNLRL